MMTRQRKRELQLLIDEDILDELRMISLARYQSIPETIQDMINLGIKEAYGDLTDILKDYKQYFPPGYLLDMSTIAKANKAKIAEKLDQLRSKLNDDKTSLTND